MMINSLPKTLVDNGRFCVWRYQDRNGKKGKIPVNPKTNGKAKSNDINTFGTFAEARDAWQKNPSKYDGIGIGIFNGLVGIDIDNCIDSNGEISSLALDVVSIVGSYTEKSPSGKGLHILCRTDSSTYDKGKFYIKNPNNGVEMYISGITNRFLTLTGDTINNEDLNTSDNEIEIIANKYMVRPSSNAEINVGNINCDTTDELDDYLLIQKMKASVAGEKISKLLDGDYSDYSSHSEADLALCNYLAFWTGRNSVQMDRIFRQSKLYRPDKWNDKRANSTYGFETINKAIEGCAEIYSPCFAANSTTGIENALKFLQENNVQNNPRYPYNDMGAGYLLADYLKDFCRPIPESKCWMIYDGIRWKMDKGTAVVEESAKDMASALQRYAVVNSTNMNMQESPLSRWAKKWSKRANRKTYIQDASTVYPVSRSDFDKNIWLLNLKNGTFDLNSYELHKHDPNDFITYLAPVDYIPNARCERWEQFTGEIMAPGENETEADALDKKDYLQRFAGYCLAGDTSEESLVILYGATSRNGKSVFVETLSSIMGSYSKTVSADTLLQSKHRDSSGPSEDIARLAGIRIANVGELPSNSRFDAALLKSLTGGDSINARFLGENSFDFVPQFKMFLHTNHLPRCSDMSVFNSNRVAVIPFSRHFEDWEQDKSLKTTFRKPENRSGILNWILEGRRNYQKYGLKVPKVIAEATNDYAKSNDKFKQYIDDELHLKEGSKIKSMDVYDDFKLWCAQNGYGCESIAQFKSGMEKSGMIFKQGRVSKNDNPTTVLMNYCFSNSTSDTVMTAFGTHTM